MTVSAMLFASGVPATAGVVEEAICEDVNDSNSLSSSDALLVLRKSVGQPVVLMCSAY